MVVITDIVFNKGNARLRENVTKFREFVIRFLPGVNHSGFSSSWSLHVITHTCSANYMHSFAYF
jgi:hypothetical protein